MADTKKEKEAKIVLERAYNVPLRKGWLKVARIKRSKKAVKTLQEFLEKHMKSDDVRLGMHLNEFIWKHGIKNPPHHVQLKAVKYDDGIVRAELEGYEFRGAVQSKPKEDKPTGLKGKLQSALGKTEETTPKEEKPVEVPEEAKKKAQSSEAKKTEKKPAAKKPVEKKEKTAEKKTTSKSTASKTTKK
ncbi:60S ribosomal protein L31 [archaeon]|nr:60S ribosomal protein L31 [archaeon]MBL7057306.1 60S ribosomal protein L31 [Candidatus Woesearchaeota archaeon]